MEDIEIITNEHIREGEKGLVGNNIECFKNVGLNTIIMKLAGIY